MHNLGELESFVESIVQADRPEEGDDVEDIRRRIIEDYKDSVFSNQHVANPPVRGPFGEATIEVKPGVTPVKQRPFRIQGERLEAWTRLIDKLIADGKLEDG